MDVGKKLLKSMTQAGGMAPAGLPSLLPHQSSKKPKVPPSAMAAAALAQKMMAMAPHEGSLANGEGESGANSTGKARGVRRKSEELDSRYYEEEFDPVLGFLSELPEEGPDEAWLREAVRWKMEALDSIGEKLSRQVMQHHDEMVRGMGLVTELERDLQVAAIIASNARRALAAAAAEVTQDLVVTANVKRKQVLVDMLPILLRMQAIVDVKARLQSTVEEGSYARALRMCSECLVVIDSCPDMAAIQDMTASIQEALRLTVERVDALLLQIAKHFDPKAYAKVVDAYAVMDDAAALADKVQTFFAQHVVSETFDVLKAYCLLPDPNAPPEDPSSMAKKSRLPYNELCAQLAEAQFRPCLHKTLEVLFDLLVSYHAMMDWQHPAVMEGVSSPPRGRMANGSSHSGQQPGRSPVASPPLSPSSRPDSTQPSLAFSPERPSTPEPAASLAVPGSSSSSSSAKSNGKVVQEEAGLLVLPESAPKQLRREITEGVRKALERGRKTVWELAARRVAALLSCESICSSSPHHFLQVLNWTNQFILAGEAFSGAEAHALRARLARQSEKYFKAFHRQNVDVVRAMVERESWARVPPAALARLSLAGLTGSGAPLLHPASALSPAEAPLPPAPALGEKGPLATFAHWMAAGNPFTEHRAAITASGSGDRAAAAVAEEPLPVPSANGVGGGAKGGAAGEEEEESEELLADFIDEESGARRSSGVYASTSATSADDPNDAATYTAASVAILRHMDKYARLMQILQPVAPEVFKGLCQLFELYFVTIFRLFGHKDAQKDPSAAHLLTPRLRSTVVRIGAALEELRTTPSASASSTAPPATGQSAPPPPPPPDAPATHPASANPAAFKERVVAVESAGCLAAQLTRARPRFSALLPQAAMGGMDHFYARTVEAVPDLREHVYKTLARILLNVSGYVEKVAAVRWELKEVGMQHNAYVDQLLADYHAFSHTLAAARLPRQVGEVLLEYARDGVAEALVEGLSRVKRCNNEGRALMSLDLQVLIGGLQHLSPHKAKPNMTIVENYIKAFYLPETEYLHWARTHPEYTRAQVVALVNLVANTNNWKRKSRLDLLEKIESGDMGLS